VSMRQLVPGTVVGTHWLEHLTCKGKPLYYCITSKQFCLDTRITSRFALVS